MDVVHGEETDWSAVASSSPCLLEMNPISLPTSVSLSPCGWHERLGHACNNLGHHGSFADDAQGFWYLLTIQDHVLTYSIVYPLKSCSEAPDAILDAIKQLQVHLEATPKAQEFTSTTFMNALIKLGIIFCPSLPYFLQENGEAENLNQMLGDMARAMMVQSVMPVRFWQFAYSSVAFLHNCIWNSQCVNSSPHKELFGTAPSIKTLYPFGADATVHIPALNQLHKLASRGIECKVFNPLMKGGWLLWEPSNNKMVQLASVVFPQFQSLVVSSGPVAKGFLAHVVNTMSLGKHPQALLGPHRKKWRQACIAELDQMAARDVWEVVEKSLHMKTINHQWVFDLKNNINGSMEWFKARLVAHGVDCTETYAPTASLISLCLVLAAAVLKNWRVASFDVSGAYLYSPVDETVLVELPVTFLLEPRGKVLRLKKALYDMRQAGRCWWKFLSGILGWMGFIAMEVNQSLYIFRNNRAIIAIWIHVNDGVVVSNSPDAMSSFKDVLCAELDIKWSDAVQKIVGLECLIGEGEVTIAQQ
ncbi:hypothetical protein O181_038576 [Austropuccinia psidii MF-1]|uniref:Reverse transcriptase Ty1/copia-type domain-containing protein n=1 Tax=Austropuccinia psidii MF-1 TaxID=1389203 RepID=A0A9Q3DE90_9BASI|nr:hypothetical protein [Austropuccinia psidii MF-1]